MVLFVLACVLALLIVAAIAVALGGRPRSGNFVYGASLIITLALCASALFSLISASTPSPVVLPLGLPWLGAHFRIDALSAFFLVVVNLGGAAASLFALGYGRHEALAAARPAVLSRPYLAGMNLVVLADDAFSFLVSWEFMSLTSWALVMAHHREQRKSSAPAMSILLMASFGTLALLLAFGLLAGAGRQLCLRGDPRARHPPAGLAALVLILALLGAGSKAGVVPLHAWLPLAHPAAPSHVSALMSGVMTKVAVYGFVRIVFDLLGPPDWWWSMLVLAIGGITAVMGVLYALMQHDLKRLLAYHTVENIGIIFIGLGLALAFKAHAMDFAAALALTAGTSARLQSFGLQEPAVLRCGRRAQRDRRTRHGASRRTDPPHAANRFRVSGRLRGHLGPAAAQRLRLGMADVPGHPAQPATALVGTEVPDPGGRRAARAVGGAGGRLLRQGLRRDLPRPRRARRAAANAQETDIFSLAAMFFLAALCLLAGILPGLFIDALAPVSTALVGASMPHQTGVEWLTIVPIAESRSSYNGLLVFLFVALSGSIAAFAIHRLASRRLATRTGLGLRLSRREPGNAIHCLELCPADPARFRHESCSARAKSVDMPPPGAMAPGAASLSNCAIWFGMTLYAPVASCVGFAAERLNRPAIPDDPPLSHAGFCGAGISAFGARDMALIRDLVFQGAQMLLVLLLAPLLTGFVRKMKARLLRRQGPPLLQPYRDLIRLHAQGSGACRKCVLALSRHSLHRFRGTWVAASLVPTFRGGLLFSLVGRPDRNHRAARQRAVLSCARRP